MKKLLWFIVGSVSASAVFFLLIYALGMGAESIGIRLYESEADQQRNFNLVMAGWLLVSLACGAYLAKKKN